MSFQCFVDFSVTFIYFWGYFALFVLPTVRRSVTVSDDFPETMAAVMDFLEPSLAAITWTQIIGLKAQSH